MVKQNNYKQFLIDMGWDEPKYGWTKEKARVKKLLREQRKDFDKYCDNCVLSETRQMLDNKPEGVFKKMGLDEKFMELLEDLGAKFITTKKKK